MGSRMPENNCAPAIAAHYLRCDEFPHTVADQLPLQVPLDVVVKYRAIPVAAWGEVEKEH